MGYRVELSAAAERDLDEILQFIAENDLPERALHVLDAIEAAIDDLGTEPNRGSYPKELAALGIRDFREVFFKPYRIIYRMIETEQVVRVFLIADGRRSLQRLLERRLLMA
jgi:toxin ParE1/3/4